MQPNTSKYLALETVSSGIVNGVLNLASAYAIFHGRSRLPTGGRSGLIVDLIGETFIVVLLSVLIPSLIARHRRRAGTLPTPGVGPLAPAGNLYVRAVVTGLIFTAVSVPCIAVLLPRIFPNGVTLGAVLLFKTFYGAAVGSLATLLAVNKALRERS